jgi:hypothetical protein
MKRILWVSLIVFASRWLLAQNAIPAGTILPVRLESSLNSRKVKTGQVISARVAQDIRLSSGSKIHEGAKLIGHVMDIKPAGGKGGAQMSLRFDRLVVSKRQIPITASVRALASMMAVEEAQIPESGPDRGTTEEDWVTDLIGEDAMYRGGGPVASGLLPASEATSSAGDLAPGIPGTKCRAVTENREWPRPLWVFSPYACGAYGFSGLVITHAGRTNPVGEITLAVDHGDVSVRAGSGMLLRVVSKKD